MDNPLGMHIQVWSGGWSPEEVKPVAERVAEIGYKFLELPCRAPETLHVDALGKILQANGLFAVCGFVHSLETDVASTDPAVVAKGEALMMEALAKARDLGAKRVVGCWHGALAKYTEPRSETGRRNAANALRKAAERARELGMVICLEALNRYENNFMNTADELLAMIAEVGADNLYCHLDTFHMNIEEADPAAAIRAAGKRLGYFHVAENYRGYLGTGTVDFTRIFRALAETGYDGPISLEVFSSAVVNPQHSGRLAIWRRVWSDSDDMSRHAYTFLRSQMESARRARRA